MGVRYGEGRGSPAFAEQALHSTQPLPVEPPLTPALRPQSGPTQWRALLVSLRPRQWTKNALVFLALLFSINQYWFPSDSLAGVGVLLGRAVAAFLLFCAVASAEYLVNDLVDAPQDREHPVKRLRPLASGQLSTELALAVAAALAAGGVAGGFLLQGAFGLLLLGYCVMMLAYSLALKHLVIIDVFVIAIGFVARAVAGALVIGVPISPWLYLCTILGALFIGFSKRRQELVALGEGATNHRRTLEEYTPELLDQMVSVVTSSTVIAYSLYTFSAEGLPRNHAMMLTIPFVLYGVFRYLYLIHVKNLGGSPEEVLLTDRPLMLTIALWLAVAGVVLLFYRGA